MKKKHGGGGVGGRGTEQQGSEQRDSDRQKGQMDEQAKGTRIIYKVAAA